MKLKHLTLVALCFIFSHKTTAQDKEQLLNQEVKELLEMYPELKVKLDAYYESLYQSQNKDTVDFKESFESGLVDYDMLNKAISEDSFSFFEEMYWKIINSDEKDKIANAILLQMNKAKADLENDIKKLPKPNR